jgi:hypothetical protein
VVVTILECAEHGRQGVLGVARPYVVLTMDSGEVIRSIGTFTSPSCLLCDEQLFFTYYEIAG